MYLDLRKHFSSWPTNNRRSNHVRGGDFAHQGLHSAPACLLSAPALLLGLSACSRWLLHAHSRLHACGYKSRCIILTVFRGVALHACLRAHCPLVCIFGWATQGKMEGSSLPFSLGDSKSARRRDPDAANSVWSRSPACMHAPRKAFGGLNSVAGIRWPCKLCRGCCESSLRSLGVHPRFGNCRSRAISRWQACLCLPLRPQHYSFRRHCTHACMPLGGRHKLVKHSFLASRPRRRLQPDAGSLSHVSLGSHVSSWDKAASLQKLLHPFVLAILHACLRFRLARS